MILDNWNTIMSYLVKQILKIEIVEDYLTTRTEELKELNYIQLRELFLFLFMENITIDEVRKIVYELGNRHRSDYHYPTVHRNCSFLFSVRFVKNRLMFLNCFTIRNYVSPKLDLGQKQ